MAAKPEENLVIEPGITAHPLGPAVEIMQARDTAVLHALVEKLNSR